jgi:hypothetical protein
MAKGGGGGGGGGGGRAVAGGGAAVAEAPARTERTASLPDGVTATRVDGTVATSYDFTVNNNKVQLYTESFVGERSTRREVAFVVNGENERRSIPPRDAARIAMKIKNTFLYDISKQPEGTVYFTQAFKGDGFGERRTEAYVRIGFSNPKKAGQKQYGVVKNGKLVPANANGKPL